MEKITRLVLSICLVLGTFSLKAQTFTNYTTANGMPHLNVNCLTEDASGNMWFGTYEGVSKYDGVNWDLDEEPMYKLYEKMVGVKKTDILLDDRFFFYYNGIKFIKYILFM